MTPTDYITTRRAHDAQMARWIIQAAKAPTKKPKGIDLGDHYVVDDDGKIKANPDKVKRLPLPAQYAKKNKRTWKGTK